MKPPVDHLPPPEPPGESSKVRNVALLFAFWLLVAVVDSSEFHLNSLLRSGSSEWWGRFARTAPVYAAWALLTPLILSFSRRVDPALTFGPTVALLHAAGALVSGQVVILVWAVTRIDQLPPGVDFVRSLLFYNSFQLLVGLLVYLAIVGGHYLFRFRSRARHQALAALEARAAETALREELLRAELSVLRTRLQPHFLFNALHSISALVLRGDSEIAVRMISRLSDLLRASLDLGDEQLVPVSRELEILEPYLDLCRMRHGDRAQIVLKVQPRSLPMLLPALVLQPLVENAVQHAIGEAVSSTTVQIEIALAEDRLLLKVCDDGPGFPADVLDGARCGLGLEATRERIAGLFGAGTTWTLDNRGPDGGACVTIGLPARRVAGP